MIRWLERFRRRVHPLHHLRRVPPVMWIRSRIDRPWLIRIDGIPHPVAVRLGRNLGTVLSSGLAEEREERDLLIRLSRANHCRVFWDVGANYGLFTFGLRAGLADVQIEAFEPDPDYVALLHQTLALSGPERVRVHPFALSDKSGIVRFQRDLASGSTGTLLVARLAPGDSGDGAVGPGIIDVMASTMDAESARVVPPDLLKIDVEGAELAVLSGGKATIQAGMPIILLECTDQQVEVRRLLESLGYEVRDPRRPTARVDGPGMPFMALAVDPSRHRLGDAPILTGGPG